MAALTAYLEKVLNYGTSDANEDIDNRSINFSNGIYLALPAVYLIFILINIEDFLVSPQELNWDQFIVPVFIGTCLIFLELNRRKLSLLSRMLFLICWPLMFHIVPIIMQETPDDYYIAWPFGLVFHGVLIHSLISRKTHPVLYWVTLGFNIISLIFFLDFLKYFDTAQVYLDFPVLDSDIYRVVVILYWLLFNLTTFYFVEAIDYNLNQKSKSNILAEKQALELAESLEKLKETQQQLVQSEKMASIGNLASGMAHELNNPLNIINGGLTVFRSIVKKLTQDSPKPLDAEEKKDLLTMMESTEHGINRATKIVNSLMLSIKESSNPIQYDLSEIADNVLYLSQFQFDGIEVTTDFREVRTLCFPSKVQAAISNILDNAVYWSRKTDMPKITFEVNKQLDKARISISNNGPAIPKDQVNEVFDPFFTTKEQGEGTGLGLYQAYQLVKEHQGDILIVSGQGIVRFDILLPMS